MQTLVVTDIALDRMCALLVREQRLLTEVLGELRKLLPFPLLGLDTDNDSVFMDGSRLLCTGSASSSRAAVAIARTTRLGSNRRMALLSAE